MTRLACLLLLLPAPAFAAPVAFNRDIRPLFSENCFACHGPDTAKRKGGLRLDTADGAKDVLVAGKPAQSELYKRLVAEGKGRMPPRSHDKTLAPSQIALVKRWIEEGAKYQPHWSLIAPVRPDLPAVKDARWPRGAIDRFILARLEAEGGKPSSEAGRRALIRRLSFDLAGLPPSPGDVEAFVRSGSPRAYEDAVEALLASKHFGERMALHWLDLVRYADTGGYHSDNHRDVALYRDWVIRAFNANKRFDAFTTEQLAGDLMPGSGPDEKIASGYNRLLMTTEEGGAQAKEYAAKYAADRVRNASVVWLGLTMGCAECHSHKYDPVTIKEFYSFAAFWADIQEKAVGRQEQTRIAMAGRVLEIAAAQQEIARARQELAGPLDPARFQAWQQEARAGLAKNPPAWKPVTPASAVSAGKARLAIQPDGSVLASGPNPAKDVLAFVLKTDQKQITGLRLTALRDPSLNGLSRGNGNFVLTKVAVTPKGAKRPVALARAVADFSQAGYPVASLLAKKGAGWAVEGHARKADARTAVLVFAKPIPGGPGTELTVSLEFGSPFAQHVIGRPAFALTSVATPGLGDKAGLPPAVAAALRADKPTPAQQEALAAHYRSIAPEWESIRRKIAERSAYKARLEASMPQTLISIPTAPRMMRVLKRGNWLDDSGEIVTPGVPASLPPLKTVKRATRLDLARWLTRDDNPLVARVFVNRLWKLFHGAGLASTLDDFGAQGSRPSHPELLDWLAVEFRESGWDIKHLVRLMVMSSAYRQSSVADAAARARDPYNRLVGRQGRWRLDAEAVRDNALAVSGLLADEVGGPSVKPYQPAGYWSFLNFPRRSWKDDAGPGQHRRGLYTYWQRTFPHPSLLAFDAPSREECTVERPRSNTPQQALVLLNDPTYVEAARVLAGRILEQDKDDAGRLDWAWRRVLGRPPRAAEAKVMLPLLARHRAQFKRDPAAAAALLAIGQSKQTNADKAALAAWTSAARVLLNLHETITRE